MKRTLLGIFLSILSSLPAYAEELYPMDELISDFIETEDETHFITITQRCSALYYATAGVLEQSDRKLALNYLENTRALVLRSTLMLQNQNKKRGGETDIEAIAKNNMNLVESLSNIYVERMKKNWRENNSYIDEDQVVMNEFDLCKQLFDEL